MVPRDLARAIENLVNVADDEGCDGLVTVDKTMFLNLVKAAEHAGLMVATHIEEDE